MASSDRSMIPKTLVLPGRWQRLTIAAMAAIISIARLVGRGWLSARAERD